MKRCLYVLCVMVFAFALAPASLQAQGSGEGGEEAAASGPSVTNEDYMVTISAPAEWRQLDLPGSARTVASFVHSGSQSQIELIAQRIVNQDVAQVFFDTFRESLTAADFDEISAPDAVTIGGLEGQRSEYSIEHTGITMRVVVFSFVKNSAAFLVVGYFKSEERDQYVHDLEETIKQITFS